MSNIDAVNGVSRKSQGLILFYCSGEIINVLSVCIIFHAARIRIIKMTELTAGVWSSTICSLGIHVAFTRLPLQRQNETFTLSYVTKKERTVRFDSQPLDSLLWYEAPVFIQTLLLSLFLFLRVVGEEVLLSSDWDFMTPGASSEQLTGTADSNKDNKLQQKDINKMIRWFKEVKEFMWGEVFSLSFKPGLSKQTANSVIHTSWILQTWKVSSLLKLSYKN